MDGLTKRWVVIFFQPEAIQKQNEILYLTRIDGKAITHNFITVSVFATPRLNPEYVL